MQADWQINKQTDKHTDTLIIILRITIGGEVLKTTLYSSTGLHHVATQLE